MKSNSVLRVFRSCITFVLMLSAAMLITLPHGPALGQTTDLVKPSTLTATGNAETRVVPDLAVVRLGVQTEARAATEAREQNAIIANRVIEALKALGISERQIETSTYQVYPIRRFEGDREPGSEPPIVGYRVTNIISVRTDRLNLVPRIIDTAIEAGANTVESVDFQLEDESAARRTALKQAVDSAMENARTMAQALGVRLAKVYQVQQGGVGIIPPPFPVRGVAMEAVAPTPIFPGQVVVNASVTLTYTIQ